MDAARLRCVFASAERKRGGGSSTQRSDKGNDGSGERGVCITVYKVSSGGLSLSTRRVHKQSSLSRERLAFRSLLGSARQDAIGAPPVPLLSPVASERDRRLRT